MSDLDGPFDVFIPKDTNDLSAYMAMQIAGVFMEKELFPGASYIIAIEDEMLKAFKSEIVTAEKIKDKLVILARARGYQYDFTVTENVIHRRVIVDEKVTNEEVVKTSWNIKWTRPKETAGKD